MAAVNLHYPKMKVFQLQSTQVAAGALIYTYEAGTTTAKVTYSNQGLTVPNANPVEADANGEAQVWLKDDGLYKIVITDSLGVPISSTDNVGEETSSTTVEGAYNLVANGNFEANTGNNGVPSSWDLSITSAASIDIDTSDQISGLASLQFVGGASGAGTATSGFFEVQASRPIAIRFSLKASLATVGNTVKFLWYTSAKAAASVASTTVYNVTTTAPTAWETFSFLATPGSDVKYGKVEISGSTTAGTTNYDDVVVYTREQGFIVGADIASATALLVNVQGDYHDVTGTTTITSFESVYVGTVKKLHFDGILTLTHHATDLILPNGVDIITVAGDEAEFIEYATGLWRCTNYVSTIGSAYTGTVTNGNSHDHSGGDGAQIPQGGIANAAIGRAQLITSTNVSQAGSVSPLNQVNITLDPYSFFPMIHTADAGSAQSVLTGHTTDGADADAPRFGIKNLDSTDDCTYDVDYRYIGA